MWDDKVSDPGGEPGEEHYEPANNRVAALRNWWSLRQCALALANTEETGFDCTVPNQVLRGRLWIGDIIGAEKLGSLPVIKAVVTLHSKPEEEYPYKRADGCALHYVSIQDASHEDMSQFFEATTSFIHEHILLGSGVYVHCEAGVSRSAAMCIAYLIRFGRMSLDQAYMTVYCARPIICPNLGFVRQLQQYEQVHNLSWD